MKALPFILFVTLLLCCETVLLAQKKDSGEIEKQVNFINGLIREEKNELAFESVKKLEKSLHENAESYIPLMSQFCQKFILLDTAWQNCHEEITNLVFRISEKKTDDPYQKKLQIEAILQFLNRDRNPMQKKEFIKERKTCSERLVRIWRQLASTAEEKWDEEAMLKELKSKEVGFSIHMPQLNMDPNDIKDTETRKKYIEYESEKWKINAKISKRRESLKFNNELSPMIKKCLVSMYSHEPKNDKELESILSNEKVDKKTVDEIVAAIK